MSCRRPSEVGAGRRVKITRLTILKGLFREPSVTRSFALFLTVHAREAAAEMEATDMAKGLME
jgi:hypothetical protein